MIRWLQFGMFVLCLALMAAGGTARAETEPAGRLGKSEYLFDQAIQNYLKGDSGEAIRLLNDSLKTNPDNQRVKVFLLKILVERGSRLFLAKQYEKAYTYLSQAYNMDPKNTQVKQMFALAAKQVRPPSASEQVTLIPKQMQERVLQQEAEQNTLAQGGAAVKLDQAAPSAQAAGANKTRGLASGPLGSNSGQGAPPVSGGQMSSSAAEMATAFAGEYAKNVAAMTELLASFQNQQAQQISQFMAPLERIQNLYYQSEQDRKNFMNQLDSRFKSVLGNVSFQQRMVIYGFLGALLILGLIVWAFLMILNRMRSKREEVIMKYQQEMLKMIRDMSGMSGSSFAALPNAAMGSALPLPHMPSIPQLTARPGGPETGYAADPVLQLEYMARSGNYKERSLAAVKILNYDVEKALEIIRQMITDPDPFLRENIAAALGQQYHPMTVELLLECLKDNEKRVVAAALRAAKQLDQLPEETMPDEIKSEIQLALKNQSIRPEEKKRSANRDE
ncbi:HEAT repeat domain-containing protein [candidate division FCPU426 bacterium]|nr:HEAT repeat domain-containing protein [candidate division FCPU426 bacterium]